ncbi:hypothetical protein ASD93_15050 [Microbacterium sp. Root180]|nr:hypothetical protein ASD93_15050 [Microbacterium sp. Root180]
MHDVISITIDPVGRWLAGNSDHPGPAPSSVIDLQPEDIVFPVLHGGWGENGGLQRELHHRGIRYVGCDSAACEIGMSKRATARTAAQHGVRTIPTRIIRRHEYFADVGLVASALARAASFPLVVKPDSGGSSVGVYVVHNGREMRNALNAAFELDDVVLLQPLIVGAEVSVGVWSGADGVLRVSGASLLHLPSGVDAFSYEHKYAGAGGWLEIPAAICEPASTKLTDAALRTARAVGVVGLSRIDFFLVDDQPVLNEINTLPGLRRESHFPRLIAAAGTSYDDLLAGLVEQAMTRNER